MIEHYLPALLKVCKLAAAVKLLASIWELLVRNIGPDILLLFFSFFFMVLLGCSQLCQTNTRLVPQNEVLLFRSTSYGKRYSHPSYYSHSSVYCVSY
jgi:hypothetical protein